MSFTIIDFTFPVSGVKNFKSLPPKVQALINGVERLRRYSPQEVHGVNGRTLVFSAMVSYLSPNRLEIESIGWHDETGHWGWTPAKGVYQAGQS